MGILIYLAGYHNPGSAGLRVNDNLRCSPSAGSSVIFLGFDDSGRPEVGVGAAATKVVSIAKSRVYENNMIGSLMDNVDRGWI